MKNVILFFVLILGIETLYSQTGIRETTLCGGVNANTSYSEANSSQFIDKIEHIYLKRYGVYNLVIYDNEEVDRDIIIVDMGNGWIDYIIIRNNPTIIPFSLKRNQPFSIKITAESEGSIPPCTIAMMVDGFTEPIVVNIKKGKSVKIEVQKKDD